MRYANEGWTLVSNIKRTTVAIAMIATGMLVWGIQDVRGGPAIMSNLKQVTPLRQDSLKVPSVNEMPKGVPSPTLSTSAGESNDGLSEASQTASSLPLGGYDPSGRRDPFAPMLNQLAPGQIDPSLPPLQRVGLTDMNLIAVIWGAYGYTAMVQMPDGNGYTVRKGTRMGPNNGVVSAISEKGIIVQERFTDVYGRKQEREYVKLLHSKEGQE